MVDITNQNLDTLSKFIKQVEALGDLTKFPLKEFCNLVEGENYENTHQLANLFSRR